MNVIDRPAIARSAAIGLLSFVPISGLQVLVDRSTNDFDHSGWKPVFAFAYLMVYCIAGFTAVRMTVDAPYSNGILGAMGAFVLWIPLRTLIWAVRSSDQRLLGGRTPVFTPTGVLGQFVFAAALGAIGAVIASRRRVSAGAADPRDD